MDYTKVDFHIHTYYSDGQLSPSDVVLSAVELGYEQIAITDHDGIDGVAEAMEAAEGTPLKVHPGIELATVTDEGIGLHILGYDFDPADPKLNQCLEDLKQKRNARNHKLLRVLHTMGYHIDYEELEDLQPNGFIGKPVIARAMVNRGYIKEYDEAFQGDKIFGSKEARKVKKEKLNSLSAISLIKEAGGVCALAHPIQTRNIGAVDSEEFYINIETIISKLKKAGLDGLECFHPDQKESQSLRFLELADKYSLGVTRGSDYHGKEFLRSAINSTNLRAATGSSSLLR